MESIEHNGRTIDKWRVEKNTPPGGEDKWTLVLQAYAPTYKITVDKSGLNGATMVVVPNDVVKHKGQVSINITPDNGQPFAQDPVLVVEGIPVKESLRWVGLAGCYLATYENPTGDVTITVSGGEVPPPYNASLNVENLKGATAKLDKEADIQPTDLVKVTVKPDKGKRFDAAPTMTVDGAAVKYPFEKLPDGSYVGTVSEFAKNAVVKVEGATVDGWTATLDTAGLKGGKASLKPDGGFGPDSEALLSVVFGGGATIVSKPVVTVDNATVKPVSEKDGTFTFLISGFKGNATVKVVGEGKFDTYTAKLDTAGLKGAAATLDKTSGISGSSVVWLKVVPEAGKSFASDPVVTATNATVHISKKSADGSYTYTVSDFTGNATVKVTGEAKGANPIDIKVSGDGKHVVGAGGTIEFTCPLPLEELVRVSVDGKALDKKHYDAKSGSTIVTLKAAYLDTLAVGKHEITLSYTGDRAASAGFEVTKAGAKPVPAPDGGDGKKLAKTGDPLDAAPLAGVLGLSAVALAGAFALRKRVSE